MDTVIHKQKVSHKQLELLQVIFKYRFITSPLAMDMLKIKTRSTMHQRLQVLQTYGFISQRYEKNFKLRGIPAYYYMTPAGLRFVDRYNEKSQLTKAIISNSYKDPQASMAFIQHTVAVGEIVVALRRQHPALLTYTKRSLGPVELLNGLRPDMYLSLPLAKSQSFVNYLFDYITETMPIPAIRVQLKRHIKFCDRRGWSNRESRPMILLLFETTRLEKRLGRRIRQMIYSLDGEGYHTHTATIERIAAGKKAWAELEYMNDLYSLDEIRNE